MFDEVGPTCLNVFQISGVILAAEPSIKSFTFIFLGLPYILNQLLRLKSLEHLTMAASAITK